MKKLLVFISAVFLFSSSLFSFEWGGMVNNESKILFNGEDSIGYVQSNGANLWLSLPITKDNNWKLNSEISYKFDFGIVPKPIYFNNVVNLPLLKVSGSANVGKNKIDLSFGRFKVSDYTSKIFNATADGLFVDFNSQILELGCYVGYTGLTNRLAEVGFLDNNGALISSDGDFYVFEESYIPAIFTVAFPSLFANQTVTVQALASFDCSNNKNNKYYGTLGIGGPILSSLFYDFKTTFNTCKFNDVANLTSISFTFFAKKGIGVVLSADYASGSELCFDNFTTVTSFSVSDIFNIGLSDVFVPSLSFLFTAKNFYAKLDVNGLFTIDDSIETQALLAKISSSMNVYSDFQLGFDLNALIPINKSFATNIIGIVLKGAISF